MELYINGTQIELPPGEIISLDKSVGRIGQIATRSGVVSVDFDVPETASNIAALGYNDRLETEPTVSPSDKQPAYITDEGHEVARGFIQIVSWDHAKKIVSLTFFGGNTNWFELLRGKRIGDVDLSAYDHLWTEANITDSWANTEGYIYPAIDYGRLTGQIIYYTFVDDWYPAVFYKTVLKQMFREIGYKIDGSFTNEFEYKNLIIPFSRQEPQEDINDFRALAGAGAHNYAYSVIGVTSSGNDIDQLDIDTIVSDPEGAISTASDNYTAQTDFQNALFRVEFNGETTSEITNRNNTEATLSFRMKKNGTPIFTELMVTENNNNVTTVTSDYYSFDIVTNLTTGDVIIIELYYEYTSTADPTTYIDFSVNTSNLRFEVVGKSTSLIPGGPVTISETLPDISQTDFVRDLIIRNNLLITSDNITGTVYLNRFDTLYNKKTDAIDWSDKVDLSGLRSVDFTEVVNGYARTNIFKYKSPKEDDIYLQDYNAQAEKDFGEGRLSISNAFLPDEIVIHESPFGATYLAPGIQNTGTQTQLPHIPQYDYTGTESGLESNPRLLYVLQNVPISDFADGFTALRLDGTQYTETAYAWFSKPQLNSDLDNYKADLSYDLPNIDGLAGDSALSTYYANLSRILNKPRYLEISLRLWPQEFRELDFTVPVYISAGKVQGYFYIDEIEGYEGERKPVTAKLVQLI